MNHEATKPRSDRLGHCARFVSSCLGGSIPLVLMGMSGCTPPPATPPAPQAQGPSPLVAMLQPQPSNAPLDAAAATPYVFHVEMFLINPPAGSFSGNEDFWKTIDEQCVDPATADLLQRNGVRVGVAPLQELENFAKYLEGIQPIQKLAITG